MVEVLPMWNEMLLLGVSTPLHESPRPDWVVDDAYLSKALLHAIDAPIIEPPPVEEDDTIEIPKPVALQRRHVSRTRACKHMGAMPCMWMKRLGRCPILEKQGSCPFHHTACKVGKNATIVCRNHHHAHNARRLE